MLESADNSGSSNSGGGHNGDDQGSVRSIAKYLFLAVVFSWIMWLINEGGRSNKFRKKKEKTSLP